MTKDIGTRIRSSFRQCYGVSSPSEFLRMPSDFLHLYWLVLICNSRALPSSSSLLCSRHDLILNFRGNILFPPPFFYKLITVLVLADAELISLARRYKSHRLTLRQSRTCSSFHFGGMHNYVSRLKTGAPVRAVKAPIV